MFQRLKAIHHPERYHGFGRKKKFFEGWYYKIIDPTEEHAFAIIPGIAMDKEGNQQAFIQTLDGKNQTAHYEKFDAADFDIQPNTFELKLAGNYFTQNHVKLNLPHMKGELILKNQIQWPSSFFSPGIMGPFSFVPFMECYHGILSMNHDLQGTFEIDGKKIDFTNGKGYAEKDWGHSFPKAYVWMQTNHFSHPDISLKASVAKIPWMGSAFTGFIAGLWWQNELIQFTTYNCTKLRKNQINEETVTLTFENSKYQLNIVAHRSDSSELAAPIQGFMDGRIEESMTSKVVVNLVDKKQQKTVFSDTGRNAGLEVAGEIEQILVG